MAHKLRMGVDQPGMAQLVASLYYRAAKNAGERGKDPLAAERAFAACEPSAKHLAAMELYGPMGLFQAYSDPLTAQRHLAQQGYMLVLSELEQPSKEHPAFLL